MKKKKTSLCFAKTTKQNHLKKKKKATSLQKTENLSPLRKTFQSCGKSNTFFFEKKKTSFAKIQTSSIKKKNLLKKKNPSPGEKKRKNGPIEK